MEKHALTLERSFGSYLQMSSNFIKEEKRELDLLSLNHLSKTIPKSEFVSFVRKYLIAEGLPCGRHCDKPNRFVTLLEERERVVGGYVCPDNYIGHLVCFEPKDHNLAWFQNFVLQELGGGPLVRERDFRKATRHGWELGSEAEKEITSFNEPQRGIEEYYWTFYARGDEEKKTGNFLCEACSKLFAQPLNSKNKKCKRH